MTINEIMNPFVQVIDWLRNRSFMLGEFSFTFFDLFTWQLLAMVLIGFIIKIRE